MNKRKKERFIDPGILTILDDIKFGVVALVGAGLVVAVINGDKYILTYKLNFVNHS